jgi:ATP-binding protein involved in chromosome partitioning
MSIKPVSTEEILARLKDVMDPELKRSIVDLGMVEKVEIKGRRMNLYIKLTIPGCPLKEKINQDIRAALAELHDIDEVNFHWSAMTQEERQKLTQIMTGKNPSELFQKKGVGHVVLVASGKGGVGKSTVTANLAISAAQSGYKVGLLDADIHGFSIPRILGLNGNPTVLNNTIIPLEKYGLRVISMGFFMEETQAVIWRGPMVHKAVSQFLNDVFWDGLDFLFVDLPPGTGDVALSLSQILSDVNAIIVTTPQPGASVVASRMGEMAAKASMKLMGIVENMSYFLAPSGVKEYIFGSGGGQELSERLNVPLLGQIPLETEVRAGGDEGIPIVVSDSRSEAKEEFVKIARRIVTTLEPSSNVETSRAI